MGWKAIKDQYNIEHLVAVYEGEGICIGSAYVHGLIIVDCENRTVKWGKLGPSTNDDLVGYWLDIHEDIDRFWKIAESPDTFAKSLPVYTFEGGNVVECQCEEYGWPNVTHDGRMMYENMFFERREDARQAAIRSATSSLNNLAYMIGEAEKQLHDLAQRKAKRESDLARLESLI